MIKTIEHRANEFPMHKYLKEKNLWDEQTLRSVDWDAFKLARKNYPVNGTRFVTKMCCQWLATGHNLKKQSAADGFCIHCKVDETQSHIFRCPARSKWRARFITNLGRHLKKTRTNPTVRDGLMEGIDSWLTQRKNVHPLKYQEDIGWEQFLYGFLDAEWRHKQAEYKPTNLGKDERYLTP